MRPTKNTSTAMKKVSVLSVLFAAAAITASAAVRPVELENCRLQSSVLGHDVAYSVVIPADADKGKHYPVLYMLHGVGGDHSSCLEYTDVAGMMQRGEMPEMIVVMPDGYLSYYSDAADGSLPYETFFTTEFIQSIDSIHPTLPGRENRVISGFSMGGFGAMTLGLRNPEKFGTVISFSPSMRTDSVYATEGPQDAWEKQWGRTFGGAGLTGFDRITQYYRDRSPLHFAHKLDAKALSSVNLTIDIGDLENTLAAPSEMLHRTLVSRGIPHTYRVRSGGHDFECMNKGLRQAMAELSSTLFQSTSSDKSDPSDPSDPSPRQLNLANSTIWLPAANAASYRLYPVLYVRGDFSPQEKESLVKRTDAMASRGEIRPMALCFLSPSDSIQTIERECSQLRADRRFRALVDCGGSPDFLAGLLATEPWFTAVVLTNPTEGSTSPQTFAGLLKSHRRYPRVWLDQNPSSPDFGWASDLHVLLRGLDISHQYRVGAHAPDSLQFMPGWEEWLRFIDQRIHI